ncbi:transmembrane protein 268 isoform X3 [Pseudophryne corroboree]|uniref:transmembrane protein 268 isoform X3 n=1 Tax=Pseudophryne corroboree TaxID=495146 RepID=UPI0030813008
MTGQDGGAGPWSESSEPVVTLHSGLYNGRLLVVLPYTSRDKHAEQCLQSLQSLQECGIQIMYSSIWTNLYFTAQVFSSGHSWLTSISVTLTAAMVTVVVIVIINQHQKKININTDIRLAAANELFMEYNVLLGISNRWKRWHSVPSLCFIYFHVWGCHQRLSQRLASMNQDDLRQCLDQLFIYIETPADPSLAQTGDENHATEESPLLASGSREKPVLCSKKIPLIPQDVPEVMARQLLIMASACYVRLLTTGQLPRVHDAGHTGVLDVPCPCQFIENNILMSGRCFTCI